MSELTKEHFDKQLEKLATKKYVRDYLGEYTEQVLLPAMAAMLKPIEDKIDGLSTKLTAHLELSDKRYLELKNRTKLIGKWIKQIADKTGVQIDLAELEKF